MTHAGTGEKCKNCRMEDSDKIDPIKKTDRLMWWKETRQKSVDQGGYHGGTPEFDSPRSPLTTRSLGSLVQCKSFGCSWTGTLRDLNSHRKECHE